MILYDFPCCSFLLCGLWDLDLGYTDDGPLVLKDVSVRLTMASRIGVVGSNGAGKSTLLNLLAGEIIPPEDEVVSPSPPHRYSILIYIHPLPPRPSSDLFCLGVAFYSQVQCFMR